MNELIRSDVFLLTLTIGVYFGAKWVYQRYKWVFLHPVLMSMTILIPFLLLTGIDYQHYIEKTKVINFGLGLSVVALGYLLYEQIDYIRKNALSFLVSIVIGTIIGVASVVWIAQYLGAEQQIIFSLQPKSVTTPIAIAISEQSGGIPALTSLVVVFVGVFGGIIGPTILRWCRVTSPTAQGLAMGSAAHAMGTARALELGAVQGAVGGVAIGLMGLVSALLIPVMERIL